MQKRYRAMVATGLLVFLFGAIWQVNHPGSLALPVAADLTSPIDGAAKPKQQVEPVPESRSAASFFTEAVQMELKAAVNSVLPAGWAMKTTMGGSPSDWHTFDDKAGFCVEASNGKQWLHVWFLPVDWIGIRKVEHLRCMTCYWHGILKNDRFTMITYASDDEFHHRCSRLLNGSTPSLCNGGKWTAEKVFGYHSEKTDRIAMQLVERYCKTGADLGEAANSLIVLGVPARSVMLKAIRAGLSCNYSVLGQMGDPESIGVLCDRLRQTPSKDVVYALAGHDHPKLRSALRSAIRKATYHEDIAVISRRIGQLKYLPAAPDVAAAFQRLINNYDTGDIAHALASLNYRKAIPLLEKAVANLPANANDGFRNGGLRVALLRFTADWGIPDENVRVHIAGPKKVRAGVKIPLSIYVEVIGKEPISTWRDVEYGLQIDGNPLIERKIDEKKWFMLDGSQFHTDTGDVMILSYDIGLHLPYLPRPASYTLQYGNGKTAVSSNAIVIEVVP